MPDISLNAGEENWYWYRPENYHSYEDSTTPKRYY